MFDVAVLGGGASGLAASISAAKSGAQVILLEANARVGRKIAVSGNGRCNILNTSTPRYEGDPAFAAQVLRACPPRQIMDFFSFLGLPLSPAEEDGRVYPVSERSGCVLDTLLYALKRENITLRVHFHAERIDCIDDGFSVREGENAVTARKLIIACGSPAGGALGTNSYHLLHKLGYGVTDVSPALSPLLCDMKAVRALKGLRVPALLLLNRNGKTVDASGGEILFSDAGISGICAMQLSRSAQKGDTLHINFLPLLGLMEKPRFHGTENLPPLPPLSAVHAFFRSREALFPFSGLLTGLMPGPLANVFFKKARNIDELSALVCDFPLTVTGVKGMEAAQVAAGGVDTRFFSPDSLMSVLHPGLYCAGEMLNIDGDCGGFNLMFAWASGILAGMHAAQSLLEEKNNG